MLRTVTSRTIITSRLLRQNNRTLVTSQQKRAIKKEQLEGGSNNGDSKKSIPPPIKSATTTTSPPPSSSSSSGGSMLPLLGLAAVGAIGAAYYMDVIPAEWIGKSSSNNDISKDKKEETKKVVTAPADSKKLTKKEVSPIKDEKKQTSSAVENKKESSGKEVKGPNRVTQIFAPPIDQANRPPQIVPSPTYIPNAHRVSVELMNQHMQQPKEVTAITINVENKADVPVEVEKKEAVGAVAKEALSNEVRSAVIVMQKQEESVLKSLRANLDDSFLSDLDSLTDGQLRIRVVQLAAELGERTKWEAVRLQEFLTRKEKEVGDKYMEILQKQRLEFEDLLARRLREQEDTITKNANTLLQSKEDSIQSLVNATTETLKQEHDAEMKSADECLNREYNAKYEVESQSNLATAKEQFTNDLQDKVNTIEELSQRLSKLEQLLQISRNFEIGSQAAHRVSAAALAMAEKLETNQGAGEEIAALNAAAAENAVIASALSQIPTSVRKGIPTITQLQSKFDKVYTVSRQAALVPEGSSGVGAQIAGMLFATLTVPPEPESQTFSNETNSMIPASNSATEFILARANRFVSLGNVEQAIAELDKLQGQTAFVTKDWKQAAMDRLSVDKAVKVIKMECALLNKNMGGS